jgi:hypothetical protein
MDGITEPSFRIVLQNLCFLFLEHPFASLPLLWPVTFDFGLPQTVSCLYQRDLWSCRYKKSFDGKVKKE